MAPSSDRAGDLAEPLLTKKEVADASTQTPKARRDCSSDVDKGDDDAKTVCSYFDDDDEEDTERGLWLSFGNGGDHDDDEDEDDEPVYRFNWCDSLMIWLVLPALLW